MRDVLRKLTLSCHACQTKRMFYRDAYPELGAWTPIGTHLFGPKISRRAPSDCKPHDPPSKHQGPNQASYGIDAWADKADYLRAASPLTHYTVPTLSPHYTFPSCALFSPRLCNCNHPSSRATGFRGDRRITVSPPLNDERPEDTQPSKLLAVIHCQPRAICT